jgi:hypothetical protein
MKVSKCVIDVDVLKKFVQPYFQTTWMEQLSTSDHSVENENLTGWYSFGKQFYLYFLVYHINHKSLIAFTLGMSTSQIWEFQFQLDDV